MCTDVDEIVKMMRSTHNNLLTATVIMSCLSNCHGDVSIVLRLR